MDNLENGIIDIIGVEKLYDLSSDYLELGLDTLFKSDLAKDIPVFATIYKIFKVGVDMKNQLFLKKLFKFLYHLKHVSPRERSKFVENANKDVSKKQEIGLKLIMLIEKLDDFNKPQILSNLLIASIKEEISTDDFLRLSSIVANTYIGDLIILKNETIISDEVKERLYTNGLLSLSIKQAAVVNDDQSSYGNRKVIINVESETKKVYNEIKDSKIIMKEIKDKIAIEFDFEINNSGISLKEFGLKDTRL